MIESFFAILLVLLPVIIPLCVFLWFYANTH